MDTSSDPLFSRLLLLRLINFAKQYTNIPDRDIDIIMHSRKSLLFNNGNAWIKKDNSSFDVTMGSYDRAEVCELVGLFILNAGLLLSEIFKDPPIVTYKGYTMN